MLRQFALRGHKRGYNLASLGGFALLPLWTKMDELKSLLKLLFGFAGVAACLWLYLKVLSFLRDHGWSLGRYDASHEPSKVEIQTLFHGNTKDEDQI